MEEEEMGIYIYIYMKKFQGFKDFNLYIKNKNS
jgi:hypothetical protein